MQFAYQFPERCERLVLGRQRRPRPRGQPAAARGDAARRGVRAAAARGDPPARRRPARRRRCSAASACARAPTSRRSRAGTRRWPTREARAAFVHTLRAVVDPGGQRVNATDRLYLAEHIPILIVWGERDSIIPVAHGRAAHELVPGSRLEVFAGAGHFPQLDEPAALRRGADRLHRVDRAGRRSTPSAGASCSTPTSRGRAPADGLARGRRSVRADVEHDLAGRARARRCSCSASAALLEREARADDRAHEARRRSARSIAAPISRLTSGLAIT